MPFHNNKDSRIKMVFLLAHGNNHLKENGYNPVRYSAIKYNIRPDKAMKKLIEAYQNSDKWKASNVIQFYDNSTNQLIESYRN